MGTRVLLTMLLAFGPVVLAPQSVAKEESGERPAVGEVAPEISAKTWINTEGDANPASDAKDKVILVEFWGTWCGPCVRSMPKIQSIWEKYRARGLMVVAMTREKASDVENFLKEKEYTMPVGCDPDQACVNRYKPRSWPSTYLIDREGKVAFVGSPYGAEAAVEKALGLESSPATLLTTYLDATATKDNAILRSAMERLVAKAPASFNVKDWAEGVLGTSPETEGEPKDVAQLKFLNAIAKAWKAKNEEDKTKALRALASGTAKSIDLRAWIVKSYGKRFPLKKKELQPLLESKSYETLIGMMLDRAPSSAVLKIAAKDEGLQNYCSKKVDDTRTLARKGLMAHNYLFGEIRYNTDKNKEFWSDLSVSGTAMSKDRKKLLGILVAGEMVGADNADSWITRKLAMWALMREFSGGDTPSIKGAHKEGAKERKRILRELASKYAPKKKKKKK